MPLTLDKKGRKMPKSETWPGGSGLETMNGMDSAGSCDSVVSANSGFSDDSLEHLSAEEKACLMFLEETIDSLDTEEDSGLSNDEPDQLPAPGSLATKLADLSASMSKSKLNGSQKLASEEPIKKNFDAMLVQSYLVPTPFVVANSSLSSVSSTKPGTPADKILSSKPQLTSGNNIHSQKQTQKPAVPPPLPIEINVVIPTSTKSREHSVRTPEGSLPRGPLSYEALVYLRKNASTKKTPLCPTIDHTIDLDKGGRGAVDVPNYANLPRSIKSHSEVSKSKKSPPAVAPKPKKTPANKSAKPQNKVSGNSVSSCGVKRSPDPEVVRLEALQKLGLLKDQEAENETVAPLPPPKSHTSLNRFTKGPNCNPPRSPSFCYAQVSTEHKNRPLQNSASFHHYSRGDQQPASHPPQTNGVVKRAVLERSVTLDNHRNSENSKIASVKPVKTTTVAQHIPREPSNVVGYTVMVVPGMGADRKEALRKLGLLKD